MRWIYLSPHLDDAALSAGGLIFEQARAGTPVEIWTLMCGFSPAGELSLFAQVNHKLWGFSSAEEAMPARREEDIKAASLLGAKTVHFDFLDAIYRRGEQGVWLYTEGVCVPADPADGGLPAQIAEAVSLRLLPDDVVVCQLAIGGHVDHVIVRKAAEQLGRPLWYDMDVPYVFHHPEERAATAGMESSLHPVSLAGLRAWERAIRAYPSQFSGLFESRKAMKTSLEAYRGEQGGINLWRPAG
ncbi:MAG: PIG-L deacetylase family protein [Bacteroidota bacterium]